MNDVVVNDVVVNDVVVNDYDQEDSSTGNEDKAGLRHAGLGLGA